MDLTTMETRNIIRRALAKANNKLFEEAKKDFLRNFVFPKVGDKIKIKNKTLRVVQIKYETIYILSDNTMISQVQIIASHST